MDGPASPPSWRRSEAALWRSLGGAGVLRSPITGEFVTLRSTANLAWLALEYPGTENVVAEDIAAALGDECRDEVGAAFARFIELGAIIPA